MNIIFEPTVQPWRGVAVVLHGLNLKPVRMYPLADELRAMGIGVVNGELLGHGDNYEPQPDLSAVEARQAAYQQVTWRKWLADVKQIYATARDLAERHAVPLFLVAFSTGGLMGCTATALGAIDGFRRMVLFAPALATHRYFRPLRLLHRWPWLHIKSVAPVDYRANRSTPVAAYLAIHQAQEQLRNHIDQSLNVPTRIFIAPRDELISYRGLTKLITTQRLTNWQLDIVSKREAAPGAGYNHLIINQAGVGTHEWQRMVEQMRRTLLS